MQKYNFLIVNNQTVTCLFVHKYLIYYFFLLWSNEQIRVLFKYGACLKISITGRS